MADMNRSGNGKVIDFGKVRALDDALLPRNKWVLIKVLEEAAELSEAGKQYIKWVDSHGDADGDIAADELYGSMLSELADVVMTVADVCSAFDIDDIQLHRAIEACVKRNAARGRITDSEDHPNGANADSGLPPEAFGNA